MFSGRSDSHHLSALNRVLSVFGSFLQPAPGNRRARLNNGAAGY
jgi:hypothetical protein